MRDGFSILPAVVDPADCDRLLDRLARATTSRGRAGMRHLMAVPEVAALAADWRLATIAAAALGGRAVPFKATLFDKRGDANWLIPWHQDTALPLAESFEDPKWRPWSVKAGIRYAHAPAWALERVVALRLHLDDSTVDNGPLRILPGTHRLGVLEDDEIHRLAGDVDAVECLVPKGGILVMSPLVVHASSKSRVDAPRRVFHLEYAAAMRLASGVTLAVA